MNEKINAPAAALLVAALFSGAFSSEIRYEDAADVGFQLLEEPINPRIIGMGAAGVAGASAGFFYYNPALAGHVESPSLRLEYGQSAGDLQRGYFEAIWPFGQWRIGAAFNSLAIDNIVPSDGFGRVPNYNHSTSAQLTAFAVNFAYKPSAFWTLGVAVNGMQDRIENDRSYALSMSGGALLEIIPDKLWAGAAGFHLGSSSSFLDTTIELGTGADLPMSGRGGFCWRDTIGSIAYAAHADAVYRYTDKRIMAPIGLELRPLEPLAIRVGKRFNHDTEIINLGAGLRLAPLTADIAFVVPRLVEDSELKWLLSVRYVMGAAQKRSKEASVHRKETQPPAHDTSGILDETSVQIKSDASSTKQSPNPDKAEIERGFKSADTSESQAPDANDGQKPAQMMTDSGQSADSTATGNPSLHDQGNETEIEEHTEETGTNAAVVPRASGGDADSTTNQVTSGDISVHSAQRPDPETPSATAPENGENGEKQSENAQRD